MTLSQVTALSPTGLFCTIGIQDLHLAGQKLACILSSTCEPRKHFFLGSGRLLPGGGGWEILIRVREKTSTPPLAVRRKVQPPLSAHVKKCNPPSACPNMYHSYVVTSMNFQYGTM